MNMLSSLSVVGPTPPATKEGMRLGGFATSLFWIRRNRPRRWQH